ncbi:MAG: hypothetical protein Q8M26_00185 [Pseudolabrys sp.]|nr:hypothetical protein [Pseudolabrys sp.]
MAGIARKVELFNLAYKLAWAHIDENPALKGPAAADALNASIRRQLAAGADDVVVIAAQAIKDLGDDRYIPVQSPGRL